MSSTTFLATTATGTTSTSSAEDGVSVDAGTQTAEATENMIEGLLSALPRVGVALVILVVFYIAARLLRGPIERKLAQAKTKSFGRVFSTIIYGAIIVAGFVVAIPIAAPSVEVAAMLGGLGLLGVAAGFAFQDILSNMLSGILLLIRDPFRSGDQIEVDGIKGTVQLITIRETQIMTFDGRLVYVPNATVYQNAIEVQTAKESVRTSLVVGVDYDADLAVARSTALDAMAQVDGIQDEPEPQAYYTEFGASSINLDLRYWTGSQQAEIRRVQDQVVERIKAAFDAKGIGIPFDIVTLDASSAFEETLKRARNESPSNDSHGQGNGDGGRRSLPSASHLREMTRAELYEIAQQRDLDGRSQMSKSELVSALADLPA